MQQVRKKGINSWMLIGILASAAVALFLLLPDHVPHLLRLLPYLLLAACPLIHMFMHGRHGHGSHGSGSNASVD